jgi:nitroreductase
MPDKANNRGHVAKVLSYAGPKFAVFEDREIPDACLEHVIELAHLAPSEWNFQPCRWIVVRSKTGTQQLEASTYINVPFTSAPAVLICLADTLAWKTAPQYLQEMVASKKMTEEGAREALHKIREYYSSSPEVGQRAALTNAFVALHQMLRAAADCDLCAYWVTEINEALVRTYFHIPDQFLVAALLALGYPSPDGRTPPPAPKLPLNSLVYKEKFGETFKACCEGLSSGTQSK